MIWFKPKCPVEDETRAWIDDAFFWLTEAIGIDVVRSVDVILPIERYFPDSFDGSRTSIKKMVERVCEYMDIDPDSIKNERKPAWGEYLKTNERSYFKASLRYLKASENSIYTAIQKTRPTSL